MEINKQDLSNADETSQLADSDEILLNYLMREYATKLKRIAYLYTNDHSECEDIIQEVFVSCYRNLSKFRNESNYETWLTRITINKCKDHLRLWRIKNLIYMPLKQPIKTEGSAEEQFIHSENSQEILQQISLLSHKFKEVLILYYFNEMTMQEISETLGINHNTVKSRLLRGKNALLKNLEGSNYSGTL
ncbi:sigma-70 family RNA polymerase sigma factor [Sporosarcina sp. FSL W8-0480]|uniref:RNA polymerase sigma factor n=1 Tax=Sporosarcina sp. FSL W8-0480 TaxID=2954701 RepID=UPI0030DD79E0